MKLFEERVAPQLGLGTTDADPALAFMLAHQAMTRWQYDVGRLAGLADTGVSTDEIVTAAEAAQQQILALQERIRPFANYVEMAVRFEAQEVVAGLDRLHAEMDGVIRLVRPQAPWRDAAKIVEALTSRH